MKSACGKPAVSGYGDHYARGWDRIFGPKPALAVTECAHCCYPLPGHHCEGPHVTPEALDDGTAA